MSVPQRESLIVEFKSDRKTISENVIVDEVVALSNTDGGELYIGVEDDGTLTGAQPQHRDPLQMSAMIANKTVPSVSVRTVVLVEDEKYITRIEVPRSTSVIASAQGVSCAGVSRPTANLRAYQCIRTRYRPASPTLVAWITPPSPSQILRVKILIRWRWKIFVMLCGNTIAAINRF